MKTSMKNFCKIGTFLAATFAIHAQAAVAPVVADTNVDSANGGLIYGNQPAVSIGPTKRAYLSFAMNSAPTATLTNKATLYMYVKSIGTAGGLRVCPITAGVWYENTLSYNSSLSLGVSLPSCVTSGSINPLQPFLWSQSMALPDGTFVAVDVTSLVKQGYSNFVVMQDPVWPATNLSFDSKESGATSHHAYLDIEPIPATVSLPTGVLTMSGAYAGTVMGPFNVGSVVSNTLIKEGAPKTSEIRVPYTGQYLATAGVNTCIAGANTYVTAAVAINGAVVSARANKANECGSAEATVAVSLKAGDLISGRCLINSGASSTCSFSLAFLN